MHESDWLSFLSTNSPFLRREEISFDLSLMWKMLAVLQCDWKRTGELRPGRAFWGLPESKRPSLTNVAIVDRLAHSLGSPQLQAPFPRRVTERFEVLLSSELNHSPLEEKPALLSHQAIFHFLISIFVTVSLLWDSSPWRL